MLFIHKLWFDTRISPQRDPQDLPTNAQSHPQPVPKGTDFEQQEGAGDALPVLPQRRLQSARLADDR
jgi:hypothetical protein